jgi:hypothetical protein
MAMYGFVPIFREAKFCGVSSCVFDKPGCAAGWKMFAEQSCGLLPIKLEKHNYISKGSINHIPLDASLL